MKVQGLLHREVGTEQSWVGSAACVPVFPFSSRFSYVLSPAFLLETAALVPEQLYFAEPCRALFLSQITRLNEAAWRCCAHVAGRRDSKEPAGSRLLPSLFGDNL